MLIRGPTKQVLLLLKGRNRLAIKVKGSIVGSITSDFGGARVMGDFMKRPRKCKGSEKTDSEGTLINLMTVG